VARYHFKIALGGAATLALAITFAIGRSPAPPVAAAVATPVPFDETWNEAAGQAALQSASLLPHFVKTETIKVESDDVNVTPPPEDEPKKKKLTSLRHRDKVASVERNICTRHGKRKVMTHGGKSWRCR
jgi:hypothetical protein